MTPTEPIDPAVIMAEHIRDVRDPMFCNACPMGVVWPCAQVLLAERVESLEAGHQRVRALAEPFLGQSDGYQHYALTLTDGVHFVVLVEDLRAALEETR